MQLRSLGRDMHGFSYPFFTSQSSRLLRLGIPIATYSVLFSSLVVVDTFFASQLGVVALAAVGFGASLDILFRGFAIGVIHMGRSYIARAWGARNHHGVGHITRQSLWLAQMLGWGSVAFYWLVLRRLIPLLSIDPQMIPVVLEYTDASIWSVPALAGFYCFRYLVEAAGKPSLSLRAVIVAALINVVADWALMFGHLGLPALGVFGCGLATTLVYWGLFLVMGSLVYRHRGLKDQTRVFSTWEWPQRLTMLDLLRVGTPVGLSFLLTEGFFSAVAFLAALASTTTAAAYAILYAVHSIFFRTMAGISAASNVLVSRSLGFGVAAHARIRFIYIFTFGAAFTLLICSLLFIARQPLVNLFGDDASVQQEAIQAFFIFMLFEFVNGLRILVIDVLRAYKDTRPVLSINLCASYGIGIPLMMVLMFQHEMGLMGLVVGLLVMMSSYLIMLSIRYFMVLKTSAKVALKDAQKDALGLR